MLDSVSNTKNIIRWGILGCSRVFHRRWGPALQNVKDADIVALASRSPEKAHTWAAEFQIPKAYGCYDELLKDKDIDAVFIGLPNSLHCEWVCKALDAKKHVLCDKPLGISADQARRMADAAEKNQRLLMEGFMYRYHQQYDLIRQWLNENRIGTVKMIRIGFSFLYDDPGNFRYDPALGGGALLDLGCYCVNIVRLITNSEPRFVSAHSVKNNTGADWTTSAILHFDRDVMAILDCSFDYEGDRFLHVAGEKGMIVSDGPVVSGPEVNLKLKTLDQSVTETIPPQDLYAKLIEDFQRRLILKNIVPTPARDAVANLRVLDAIRQAAESTRQIQI
jgi:xylose dehydrogenase (NAD/NADP)